MASDLALSISNGWKSHWGEADFYFITDAECFGEPKGYKAVAIVLPGSQRRAAIRHVVRKIDKKRGGYFSSSRHTHVGAGWLTEDLMSIVKSYDVGEASEPFPALSLVSDKCGAVYVVKIRAKRKHELLE